MSPRRYLGPIALAASAAFLTACTSTSTGITVTGASAPPATPVGGASAAPVGGSSGACALLTAADVQTALSENVTATNPLAGAASGTTGAVGECVLTTDGPPLAAGSALALNAIAGTLTGGNGIGANLTSGGIAVVEATTSLPISASAAPTDLPPGVTSVPGVGQQAYVLASPTGGGLALAQVSAGQVIMILDIEGKQVTSDQLTALLKAAVANG